MTKILSVNNLGKSFKETKVLQDISFDVHAGEIMAILGPNGAGKSTTIRNIMGILYPDEGSVTFHNHHEDGIPRHKIGYLPEERGLYKNVKVMDILLHLANLKDYPISKARERALAYLEKFDLKGKDTASIEELSKGMGQKVQFIASIIHEPELLILDEPFSGLDPVSQELFKAEIKQLAANGTAILLSSHQMNLVEEMCDRLLLIYKGQKVIDGSMDKIKRDFANFKCTIHGAHDAKYFEQLPQVERVESEGNACTIYLEKDAHIASWIKHIPEDITIEELSIDRISLHEIFINIASGKQQVMQAGGK